MGAIEKDRMLQFRGDQTVIRIDLLELTFGESRAIAQTFDLLGLRASGGGHTLAGGSGAAAALRERVHLNQRDHQTYDTGA